MIRNAKSIIIVGASRGLGRALVDGLSQDEGYAVTGISRHQPSEYPIEQPKNISWIEADLSLPKEATKAVSGALKNRPIDVLIYNVGIWEKHAFTEDYCFESDEAFEIDSLIQVNITACILLIQALLPQLLKSPVPRIILTGSTSGLDQNGRPEVTFTATKYALRGIASALREGYRNQRLTVSTLNLGYLNTYDPITLPVDRALERTSLSAVPVHDVVDLVRTIIRLSPATWVKDITVPATGDDRF
jgi:short-subunit dehydrogenase